ncbi:hypothetical protein ACHHYP_01254 [Achlya hypogyna]|uniref:Uncharacterized protein n=1 Tax=Achlya hypogyna TaxID=1202772 RepID=A0A1V9Z9C7_ACHHY|nr:hypothetical protein ACHHYP_01254 [Achlya hypogyna]
MHMSVSACCIATCIGVVVSMVILLALSLLYWSIPRVPATAHDFSKVVAERFASPAELDGVSSSPSAADMTNILMSWHSPLCALPPGTPARSGFFHDAGAADHRPRFQVQYWTQGSWLSGFTSFNQMALVASSSEGVVDGGDLYSDDCFVVLENAKFDVTYSLRVRSRVDTAFLQLFTRQWTSWSDTVFVAPYVSDAECSSWTSLFREESWYTDRRTLLLASVTVAALLYAASKRRVRPTGAMPCTLFVADQIVGDVRLLEEEVTNLKAELADAEMENKLLMRLKGYDIDQLDMAEIAALEMELHLGLQRIEEAKDAGL